MNGLGESLIQDIYPVAYASRSLTIAEANYAQIDKELLTVVFGMKKFETYLYGRRVIVKSDHKPLESILKKVSSIHQRPFRECFFDYSGTTLGCL